MSHAGKQKEKLKRQGEPAGIGEERSQATELDRSNMGLTELEELFLTHHSLNLTKQQLENE